jgi:hypothetical protein
LKVRGDKIYSPDMRMVVISAGRRALAAFVLVLAGLLAVWAATFKVWYLGPTYFGTSKAEAPGLYNAAPQPVPHSDCIAGGIPCIGVSPAWTIPAAIAIAVIGLVVAVLLHRFRRGAAEGRTVDLSRPRTANL